MKPKTVTGALVGLWFLPAFLAAAFSCGREAEPEGVLVQQPTEVRAVQQSSASVLVRWKDNSDNEESFEILAKDIERLDEIRSLKTVAKNVTSCELSGLLQIGHGYYIGVRARASGKSVSETCWSVFRMLDIDHLPKAAISSVKVYPACIAVEYDFERAGSHPEYGLCWAMEKTPVLTDHRLAGPEIRNGKVFQVIPKVGIVPEREVHIRAFVRTPKGVFYSKEEKASLPAEPAPVTCEWKKLNLGLPPSVDVYETRTPLNGRVFHAWYAIADTKYVDVRVLHQKKYMTLEKQAEKAGDCLVLVNGGFFWNGQHIGIAVTEGKPSGSVVGSRGTLDVKEGQEYNETYFLTKGCFGVDAGGKPTVCWAASDTQDRPHYYGLPMPTVVGYNKYHRVTETYPCPETGWRPEYALTAGPVLLYEGRDMFDFSLMPKGKPCYVSNYEVMAWDIFGLRSGTPDRTAVGCTADGKVVLFVCDGRIVSSKGATLMELTSLMKGIGCVHALNLDGGGSTAMVANGQRLNSLERNTKGDKENRPVITSVGFFRKK